jgi:hypothetical protein
VWLVLGGALVAITLVIVLVAVWLPAGSSGGGAPDPGETTPSASGPSSSPTPGEPTPVPPATPSPVPLDEPAAIQPGLVAAIEQIEAVEGEARGPGEVAGPAIRFRVTFVNSTSDAVDLSSTVITVDYGDARTPALQLFEPGASPLPGSVAAGATANGVFVFTIPADQRSLVHITVDYSVGVPPLEFTGPVPVP